MSALLSWLLFVQTSQAAVQCPNLQLVAHQTTPPGAICTEVAESLTLCFVCDGTQVTPVHLLDWGVTLEQLVAHATTATAPAVNPAHLVRQEVVDSPGHAYWLSASQDGLDTAALLHPDALRALLGGEVVVGIPGQGALIAWVPGDPELDTMVAVGIATMHAQAARPVSDKVYMHRDGEWVVWGETRRTNPF